MTGGEFQSIHVHQALADLSNRFNRWIWGWHYRIYSFHLLLDLVLHRPGGWPGGKVLRLPWRKVCWDTVVVVTVGTLWYRLLYGGALIYQQWHQQPLDLLQILPSSSQLAFNAGDWSTLWWRCQWPTGPWNAEGGRRLFPGAGGISDSNGKNMKKHHVYCSTYQQGKFYFIISLFPCIHIEMCPFHFLAKFVQT